MTPTDTFQTHRPRLFSLAYRLLGSRSDAEDVVQDAWLRWQGADIASIRDPEGWLVTATTRLGLDRLRARRNARIDYVGPWLPEPLEIALDPDPLHDPAQRHARADEVSMAFLALLEQLGPDERAAFLLKDVFDYDYPDIAPLLDHSPANCRQLVHRARQRLQAGKPRFEVSAGQHRDLLTRFMDASQRGDQAAILSLLHANARWCPTAAAGSPRPSARCSAPNASPSCTGRSRGATGRTRPGSATSTASRPSCVSRATSCIR